MTTNKIDGRKLPRLLGYSHPAPNTQSVGRACALARHGKCPRALATGVDCSCYCHGRD